MTKTTNRLFYLLFVFLFLGCNVEEKNTKEQQEISFTIPDGFELEEIYHPSDHEQGSWVALAQGEHNQMFACDQYGEIYQFTIPEKGDKLDPKNIIPLALNIGEAHGMLWAFNSLYVAVNKRWKDDVPDDQEKGSGIYRITDQDNDGRLDTVTMLLRLEGSGEHGPHSFTLSPDGSEIYFIAGNHTLIPDKVKKNSRIPTNWGEDNLFTPFLDARGHANDVKAPGAWITKFNEDGSSWELISVGYRNPFDLAFNADGELFTYDADMEWDIGMPWYRPTRICHVTSASEYGWRTGSGKWPSYYPDNLPAVHNLEQGSPTAVLSTSTLNFPEKYTNGLLAMDWSFGTVYFIDLKPKGSSYEAKREEFLSGTPLPLTDMIAGNDGNVYFATGGRRLDSRLYRLSYTKETIVQNNPKNTDGTAARNLRKELEKYHGVASLKGTELAWDNLDHPDRFIRYAARIVLEHQPLETWLPTFKNETNTRKIIEASIALSHKGLTEHQSLVLNKLQGITLPDLDNSTLLDALRAYSINFIRSGKPDNRDQQSLVRTLAPLFPASSNAVSKELAQLLLFLDEKNTVKKLEERLEFHTAQKTVTEGVEMLSEEATLRSEEYGPLIRDVISKMPPSEAIFYGMLLSNAKEGWNKDLRTRYFSWYFDVLGSNGGRSFKAYMENVRQRAMVHVPKEDWDYFQEISGVYSPSSAVAEIPQPIGPGKIYTGEDMGDIVWGGLDNYKGNIENGKRAFAAATCILCHRMRGEGGAAGPDLTQAHSKFSTYDLFFAIYSPNDEISDQYANTLFHLNDNTKIAGRVKSEVGDSIVILPNPFNENYTIGIAKSNIVKKELSPVSPMPPGLLNRLNKQEVADLFAYIISGGDSTHEIYNVDNND
ncbi:putative heme-binding domain-containing protein [Maribacter sedimenticola]|uniref:Heme-binding domain-containing protein n=1 Tax=Maribacter sedimenticola TaxID=228956 RepID=A0ABY1SL66_9FLAO|nr:c-type cytochrome [Maribacter sedimenticola]SNR72229.1 putative heme-binding domain-containing protein [Maribacter sedimenticola]